jgi:fatty acid-binding protein DegV
MMIGIPPPFLCPQAKNLVAGGRLGKLTGRIYMKA